MYVQANLSQHIPVFVTEMGMKDLEDLLEFDHGTLVSIMGEEDTNKYFIDLTTIVVLLFNHKHLTHCV